MESPNHSDSEEDEEDEPEDDEEDEPPHYAAATKAECLASLSGAAAGGAFFVYNAGAVERVVTGLKTYLARVCLLYGKTGAHKLLNEQFKPLLKTRLEAMYTKAGRTLTAKALQSRWTRFGKLLPPEFQIMCRVGKPAASPAAKKAKDAARAQARRKRIALAAAKTAGAAGANGGAAADITPRRSSPRKKRGFYSCMHQIVFKTALYYCLFIFFL